MTYVYVVGYGTQEESDYTYLTHEKKLTNTQLRKMVEDAVVTVVKNRLRPDPITLTTDNIHSYEDVHNDVINVLTKDFGFKNIEVTASWTTNGWPSIFYKDSWSSRDQNLVRLRKKLNRAGFSKDDDSMMIVEKRWKVEEEAKKKDGRTS